MRIEKSWTTKTLQGMFHIFLKDLTEIEINKKLKINKCKQDLYKR